MEQQYMEVPSNIITGKDLDYLSDMFEWNYGALKKTNDAISNITDSEIEELLQKGFTLFDDNLNAILDILSNTGGVANE